MAFNPPLASLGALTAFWGTVIPLQARLFLRDFNKTLHACEKNVISITLKLQLNPYTVF